MREWVCSHPVEMTEMQGDEAHILRIRGDQLAEPEYPSATAAFGHAGAEGELASTQHSVGVMFRLLIR